MSTPKNQYKNQRKKRKKQIPQSTLKPESKKQKILAYTIYFIVIIVITLFCSSIMLDKCIIFSDQNTSLEFGTCVSITSESTGIRRKNAFYVIELDTGSMLYITEANAKEAGYSFDELKDVLFNQELSIRYTRSFNLNYPKKKLVQVQANDETIIPYDIFNRSVVYYRVSFAISYLLLIGVASLVFFTRRLR